MRISKEMYMKLSKNKREELDRRIKENRAKTFFMDYSYTTLKYLLGTIILSFVIFPLWKLAYPEYIDSLSIVYNSIVSFLVFFLGIAIVIDFLIVLIAIYKKEKIKSEYFTIKVEVKK